ncbi:MAG: TolC family protein [Bacteroidales bacterium]|nr:TolC family protein [Bacteroidales bacterium]MDT8431850.1 TolC family protein [Bacteroidales bacterium]
MRKIFLAIAATIFITSAVSGQDTGTQKEFGLQEAVDYALQHNKDLKNARQELTRTERSIWEAISQGLPQANLLVDYMTYFNYELAFEFGSPEDVNITPDMINTAISNTLDMPQYSMVTPQDLNIYFAGSEVDRQIQGMLPPSTILMSDQLTAKMQVSQLVFSGQYIVGIQTAKLGKIIAAQALDNSEVTTKESVINAYYLVLISERSLGFVDQNLENLEKIFSQTKKMVEAGMAEKLDADQFQITVNQLENTKKMMERNLELNYNMLRFTLGLPAGAKLTLTDHLDDLFTEMESVNLLMETFNPEENITYQILESQAEINKKLWDMEKWNYGPSLAAFYNYNFKILTTGFDMTPTHLLGFSLNVPIFSSGLRDARVDQARIEYEIADRNAEILGDQLELQNRQLKYNLQSSLENYATQKENVEVARSILENYQRKYEQGMASSMDVTQSNSNYLDAQSSYLNAMFEVMSARIQLEKLINNLSTL